MTLTLYFDTQWSNTDNWQMSITATTLHTGKDLVACCAFIKIPKSAMEAAGRLQWIILEIFQIFSMPNFLVAWVLVCPPHSKMINNPRAFGAGMLQSCFCHFYTSHQQEADAPALNFLHQRGLCASVLCGTAPSQPRWVCTRMGRCSRSPWLPATIVSFYIVAIVPVGQGDRGVSQLALLF